MLVAAISFPRILREILPHKLIDLADIETKGLAMRGWIFVGQLQNGIDYSAKTNNKLLARDSKFGRSPVMKFGKGPLIRFQFDNLLFANVEQAAILTSGLNGIVI